MARFSPAAPDLSPLAALTHGRDAERGNLLGIQPIVTARDYASGATFAARLEAYFQAARQRGWLTPRTVVVLPEYLGTWLAAAGGGPAVQRASTLTAAMRALALGRPLHFLRALLQARERDIVLAGLFRMRAASMARHYQSVFSRLAGDYGVTIVAGSILLPAPRVRDGAVTPGRGPLQNVSAVFGPDGRAHPDLARKIYPTRAEQAFMRGAALADLPAFDTPAGRLGVLVCADSWYPAAYAALRVRRVDLVAVPSAIMEAGLWDKPWAGYDGAAPPADVDPNDVGVLTEGQAWHKYAVAGRLAASGARAALNVFLRGAVWGQSTSGHSLAVAGGQVAAVAPKDGAALVNLWL